MKRTLIILLAAVALLAAILFKKGRDDKSMRSSTPVLDSTRRAEVKIIRVFKKPDTSDIQLKDGKWITTQDVFPVDTSKVNKILANVFSLEDKEVVSRNPERYAEYGLDTAEAKHVAFLDAAGQPIAQVVIGKTSGADYSSTYWRWESKPEVYRTSGNFGWEIVTKSDEWKDRKLTTAQAKDVKTIETTWKDSSGIAYHYKLEATSDSSWKMLEPQDSNWVKKQPAAEMASRIAEMSIDEFVNPKDTNLAKVNLDSPWVDVKATLKDGSMMEFKGSKIILGYAYTKHPTRKDLIKLSAWRFDSFKKKAFELLDAPPKVDSVKVDSTKGAAEKTAIPMPKGKPAEVGKKITAPDAAKKP